MLSLIILVLTVVIGIFVVLVFDCSFYVYFLIAVIGATLSSFFDDDLWEG